MAELPSRGIDRRSPLPLYFQVKEAIQEEITSGRWAVGERIPSEPELCRHFRLSRSTVRQALDELENEGLVRRERGRGAFVAAARPNSWLLQSTWGFYQDETSRLGVEVRSQVLRAEVGELPAWAAKALDLPPGSRGATVERLRYVAGKVALYVVEHLPERFAAIALDADLERGSLYQRLAKENVEVAGGRRSIRAVAATPPLAKLLEVRTGAPLAFIESVSWDADQRPFHCYQGWLRTERVGIEIEAAFQGWVPSPLAPARLDYSVALGSSQPDTSKERQA